MGLLFDGKAAETYSERNAKKLNENTCTDVLHDVDKIVKWLVTTFWPLLVL